MFKRNHTLCPQFTPIPSLRAAATLPLLVMDKINELDDPWVVAMDRAHQAGKLLARVLLAEHRSHLASAGATAGAAADAPAGISSGVAGAGVSVSGGAPSRLMGRPITLVGYGMGARLVFHCLETLAAEGGVEARGIVENAVLIGKSSSCNCFCFVVVGYFTRGTERDIRSTVCPSDLNICTVPRGFLTT